MHSRTDRIVRLNLSTGHRIEVFAKVLSREPGSLFAELIEQQSIINCGHREGGLMRLLVNCLRTCFDEDGHAIRKFTPPEDFDEWRQLIAEAKYWRLNKVEKLVREANVASNTIIIGYHGTLAMGRGGLTAEINFRKIDRLLVSGKAKACREVFGRYLNESRDWNMDNARYTNRFYLIYTFLEQAFDSLTARRYKLVSSSSTTPSYCKDKINDYERMFAHYSQFVFVRYS